MKREATRRVTTRARACWRKIATLAVAFLAVTVLTAAGPATAAYVSDAQEAAVATNFFAAYRAAIRDASAVDALLDLLIPDSPFANVELTYAGAPGRVIPFAGTFIGWEGVRSALKAIRDTSTTESFDLEEVLTTSYAVDFSRGLGPGCPAVISDCTFLVPQSNRVAALVEEERKVTKTHLRYRLDMVSHLTIEDDGKISNIHFFYDSYVPSEAYVRDHDQIVNPDIDPVLNPRRVPAPSNDATLSAVLTFFFTFANPAVSVFGDFTPLLGVITDDVVISFAGDPRVLPFADTHIREGKDEVIRTFSQQLANSKPRTFEIVEFFVGGDRVVTNTFERRTAAATHRGYEVLVQILMTAKDGKVGSIQGNFDSVITTTAFTGSDPFRVRSGQKEDGPEE